MKPTIFELKAGKLWQKFGTSFQKKGDVKVNRQYISLLRVQRGNPLESSNLSLSATLNPRNIVGSRQLRSGSIVRTEMPGNAGNRAFSRLFPPSLAKVWHKFRVSFALGVGGEKRAQFYYAGAVANVGQIFHLKVPLPRFLSARRLRPAQGAT